MYKFCYRRMKGYLTVEAAFVMPIVLFLYMLLILAGFYLYDRCVISQDTYLLAFRESRFTDVRQDEVIYGDMPAGEESVSVKQTYWKGTMEIEKQAKRLNIIEIVERTRKR